MNVIPSQLFFNCKSLKSLFFPEQIKSIGHNAFYGCCQLEELFLPKQSVELVGNPFKKCSKLKKIHIPDKTVVSAYNGAFGSEIINIESSIFIKYKL